MFFDTRLPVKCCAWNYLGCSRVLFTRLATGLALWSCCVYAGHRWVSPFLVSLLGVVVLPVGGGSWLLTRCLLPKFVVDSFLVAWWGVFESLGVVSGGSGVCSYVSMLVLVGSATSFSFLQWLLSRRRRVYGT